ncbi:hypothetical protein C8Q75DRAFT_804868 [Abortiporus biennis]|nr:hypothetical protein C8Q75DRAFT_804868 [Abortiporus biennis]
MSPVLTHKYLMRKSSNIENAPPHIVSKSGGRTSAMKNTIREASRRRRARVTSGSFQRPVDKPRKRSKVPVNVMLLPTPPATPAAAIPEEPSRFPTTKSFPRYLARPQYKAVSSERIGALAPELAETPVQYVQDSFGVVGPKLAKVLNSVSAFGPSTVPQQMNLTVNDLSADMPTHVLAVYPRGSPFAPKKVTLYPTHEFVLAVHCAHLPTLPPSHPEAPSAPGSQISVPVVNLPLPDPATFPLLTEYLYNKRPEQFFSRIFPPSGAGKPAGTPGEPITWSLGRRLAATYTSRVLLERLMKVNGVWRNACALGIFDAMLWRTLDTAWEVLLCALSLSTGSFDNFKNATRTNDPPTFAPVSTGPKHPEGCA